jgi:hypothetical protein
MTKFKCTVYRYQVIQSIIVLVFGLIGVSFYIKPDPIVALIWLVYGYLGAIVFIFVCAQIPSGHSLNRWMFKEW